MLGRAANCCQEGLSIGHQHRSCSARLHGVMAATITPFDGDQLALDDPVIQSNAGTDINRFADLIDRFGDSFPVVAASEDALLFMLVAGAPACMTASADSRTGSAAVDRAPIDVDGLPGDEAAGLRAKPHRACSDPAWLAQFAHRNRAKGAGTRVVGILP